MRSLHCASLRRRGAVIMTNTSYPVFAGMKIEFVLKYIFDQYNLVGTQSLNRKEN
jgi:hypothetical protein